MIEQRSLSIFMTKKFKGVWDSFRRLVDQDEKFKAMLAKQTNKGGIPTSHTNKGKDSARIRFAVLICLEYLLAERKKAEAALKAVEAGE